MFSVLIFIIILSVMILVHEFGHFYQAIRLGIRVEKFSLGFGPKIFGFKKGLTEYLLCLVPFGGYVKLAGDSREELKGQRHEFLSRAPLDRVKVIFAGPALNYLLAFFCFWLVNILGYPNITAKVGLVMPDYPAKEAGVVNGDIVTAIDGKKVNYWPELQNIIYQSRKASVELDVLRNGQSLKLTVALRQKVVKNILGVQQKINLMGIQSAGEAVLVRHNPFEGFVLAGSSLWNLTVLTLNALGRMFTGALSLKESVTGPLGMFYVTSEAVKIGVSAVLHLMAVLSASLAIFNLLPFPVLDGGHLFFLGLEKLRGRQLSPKTEDRITRAGLGLIITLAVFVFLNDWVKYGVWDKLSGILIRK